MQYELDSLGPDARAEIIALRRQVDAEVRGIIQDGVAAGEFDVPDVPGTTLAVLSLCIDVARWFNVNGPRTPDEVGALYADLVLRMVGAHAPLLGARGCDICGSAAGATSPTYPQPPRPVRSSSGTPTRPRKPACRRPRAPR